MVFRHDRHLSAVWTDVKVVAAVSSFKNSRNLGSMVTSR
jgi:hypothetical protein